MHGRPARLVAVLAASAAASWAVAGLEAVTPALAATTTPTRAGLFSITPASHQVRGEPGLVLAPTVVGNSSPIALRVTVIPVLVQQTRAGGFGYRLSPRARRAARRALALSSAGFTLGADARHSVYERWRPGARHHHLWAGVIFRGVPAGTPGRPAGVHAVDQLLGLDLIDLPGDAPARGRFSGLTATDAGRHRIALIAALRNVGGSVATPSDLRVVVRAAGGHLVARLAPAAGVILPGVTRDFVAELARRLPAGRYVAQVSARLHGRVPARRLHFAIAPNGLLLAPSLVAGAVTVGGHVGGRASVRVSLRNQGTRAGAPRGVIALYPLHGDTPSRTPAARAVLTGAPVRPGATASEHATLGRLHRGAYRVIVSYSAPFVATNPAQVDFTARPTISGWLSAWHFIRDHGLLLALALAAVCVAATGLRTRQGTRERRRGTAAGIRLRPLP